MVGSLRIQAQIPAREKNILKLQNPTLPNGIGGPSILGMGGLDS